jgi:tRNA-specific 2-thiouridylase
VVQLRHRSPTVGAAVEEVGDRIVLALDEPRASITPGQSAVLFDGERLLGGGRIVKARRTARL